ncbi:MAG TPA: hypothetical protein PKC49_10005 [Phycisphaerae bacterium]|nr:hypothetical protein [Phycisphaerae bacterium]
MGRILPQLSLLAVASLVMLASTGGCPPPSPQDPQLAPPEAVFSYQGVLRDQNAPANGAFDFEFRLYDASTGGVPLAQARTLEDVEVNGGLFTVAVDYRGVAFSGIPQWVEIAVRPGDSSGPFTPLSPRQQLTAVPFALGASKVTDPSVAHLNADQSFTGSNAFAGETICDGALKANGDVSLARLSYSLAAPATVAEYCIRLSVTDELGHATGVDVSQGGLGDGIRIAVTNPNSASAAIRAINDSAEGYAAQLDGRVSVTGDFSTGGNVTLGNDDADLTWFVGGAASAGTYRIYATVADAFVCDGGASIKGDVTLGDAAADTATMNGSLRFADAAADTLTVDCVARDSALAWTLDGPGPTVSYTVGSPARVAPFRIELYLDSDNAAIKLGSGGTDTTTITGGFQLDTDGDGTNDIAIGDGFLEAPDANGDGFPDFVRFNETTLGSLFAIDFSDITLGNDESDTTTVNGSLGVGGATTLSGTLTVPGQAVLGAATVNGPATVNGELDATGNVTLGSAAASTVRVLSPLTVTKQMDCSAPVLLQQLCEGRNLRMIQVDLAAIEPAGEFRQSGQGDAVYAEVDAPGSPKAAVHGVNLSPSGFAGFFEGAVQVLGDFFVAGGKFFRIDHPLDPANKYLVHACVESSEMKTIYDGTVILGEDGGAQVRVPDYLEALNADFRYQLTCVGGYAPVYVAEEIRQNAFTIAGGRPGLKVSWQLTGVRRDPYARQHDFRAEQDKPDTERGFYLHPESYGQPRERGIHYRPQSPRASVTGPQGGRKGH